MKVILMKELKGRGITGDVVDVAAGFANNYLIPQGFAKPCTKANLIKHAADAARDGREAEPAKRACIAVVENASGMRGESPAFADKGSLVVWAIEALCDPERWQWFGEEGDALRIVAAEGDGAGGPAASEDHAPRRGMLSALSTPSKPRSCIEAFEARRKERTSTRTSKATRTKCSSRWRRRSANCSP